MQIPCKYKIEQKRFPFFSNSFFDLKTIHVSNIADIDKIKDALYERKMIIIIINKIQCLVVICFILL